jgi:methionyl-tRNA formyltransferase
MKIVFMGTPAAAVPTLSRIVEAGHEVVAVYTQPDRPAGRGNKIAHSPVKSFALDRGLRLLQPTRIKTEEAVGTFRSHRADMAVVVAYGRILPGTFLDAYPYGAINVHFSLLPKYRGAAPVNWAIANGEKWTGVTTMKMDVGLDTGDILVQEESQIGPTETAPELMARLAKLGAEVLMRTLHEVDSILPQPQNEAEATLAPILKKSDGLIDWCISATEIANRVRGFQPFPGTFTTFRGAGVKIMASAVSDETTGGETGEIVASKGDEFKVVCGRGTILDILEVQPEGKRRMPVRDFINGVRPRPGERFGFDASAAGSR